MSDNSPRNSLLTAHRTHSSGAREPMARRPEAGAPERRPTPNSVFLQAWLKDLETPPSGTPRRRLKAPRPGRHRTLATVGLILLTVLGVIVTSGYLVTENISDNVRRVPDVFGSLDPSARPV